MSLPEQELHDSQASIKRICIAKIAQAHGVKGFVKLFIYAENIELLQSAALYTSEQSTKTLKINLKSSAGKYWLAQIDGVTTKEAADALKGTELWIDRDALPDIDDEEDEFYYEDLIGAVVYDQNEIKIGTVAAVDNFGAGDLLDIQRENGETFYLPFTKENVTDVNIAESRITAQISETLVDQTTKNDEI